MNISHLYHGLLSVGFQAVFGLLLWLLPFQCDPNFFGFSFFASGCVSVGFYWGREVAQNERKQGGSPWWIGFDIRLWALDSVLDLLSPIAFCIAFQVAICAFWQYV